MDNLENIGGNKPTVLGKPDTIDIPEGHALQFDGKDDAILLDTNPISGMGHFTIEVVFRPDRDGNKEQRFFHIQESDDHRVLIETRLTDDNRWFLDTFVKDGASEKTLRAKECLHPVGDWYHIALVYDGKTVRHHVNGIMESREQVAFHPMQEGKTSIGCRLNRVYWFKGAIRCVRLSSKAIAPDKFLRYE